MEIIKTELEGVVIIEPKVFQDGRGYFFESWNQKEFNEKVRPIDFVQDNESKSSFGVLRGIHFQKGKFAQSKLVRVVCGDVYDYAVDLRVGSPTFGKYVGVYLSEDNHKQFFIPRGFGHAFIALTDNVVFQYKCDNLYCKEAEGTVAWNDKTIDIDWPLIGNDINLSEKDKNNKMLNELDKNDLFDYSINYYEKN